MACRILTNRAFTALTSAIAPDAMAADIAVSEDVCTHMPILSAAHCPIVKPDSVRVNAEVPTTAPEVVITNDVAVVALQFAERRETLLAAAERVGFTCIAKKLAGYMRVMEPPEAQGMGVVGVNDSVTRTDDLCAILSKEAMSNDVAATEV